MKKTSTIRKASAKSVRKSVKKMPTKKVVKKSSKKPLKKMVKTTKTKKSAAGSVKKSVKAKVSSKSAKKEPKKMKSLKKTTRKSAVKALKKGKALKETGYNPEKDSDYMGRNMENYFRTLLLDMKKQIQNQMANTVSNLQETIIREADDSDRASQEEAFGLELRERDRGRKLLKKIEATLELIDNKEYGYCKVCGEEIGVKRLKIRPTAVLCVDCKTFDEIREKQEGGG